MRRTAVVARCRSVSAEAADKATAVVVSLLQAPARSRNGSSASDGSNGPSGSQTPRVGGFISVMAITPGILGDRGFISGQRHGARACPR